MENKITNTGGCPLHNKRVVEDSMVTDLDTINSYGDFLHLDRLLNLQNSFSESHEGMLFVIVHQVSELWLKLVKHELAVVIDYVKNDEVAKAQKGLARILCIQKQLSTSFKVMGTMTPVDYDTLRNLLGEASGFQSYGYRAVEFMLGNKDRNMVELHRHNKEAYEMLDQLMNAPSLYDEVNRLLVRNGIEIDKSHLNRKLAAPYEANQSVVDAWMHVYKNAEEYWDLYQVGELLMDVEDNFQNWRFTHMRTVQRIIGFKVGTGGSTGVGFLKKALDIQFFPELYTIRYELN
ncbi:tryptophan 2,3-dioxygenase family protein [Vibrio splendidus]|uniref:Tryptophan 2,3-dioxygenase n=2 Tax=Vibrio TaxID=662 RepID=A0AA43G036_VIBSP|nr:MULTISPECIES: tryptophan 2,3-dioxygenase family protein [Vibrio]CAH7065952.1 Tryptophan 2,3-dioxygenase [Vibrio chagasii]MDH5923138.1 tryptophan 2,3-dioxygenase family protein [Vibrio splendidus]MDH5951630.1 tryptophan 2,3-dioxygenase family protein [Vibrio crassostreae]TCN04688.1 tryptophan 2,3-dioxygenase [Vibrio crassostreae]TCT59359.1 tryptophan 2,3-dioxygenase [Vibrio crassostreae]